ncbi:hypothetical protein B484DRAFT_402693, partial [Ochromonadaceae sp. CCMP2298]
MNAISPLLLLLALLKQATGVNVFPYTSGTLTNTSDARQNTVSVQQEVCPGDRLVFSTCSQYTGDTYIKLYLGSANVRFNDDYFAACSQIDHTYTGASCGALVLQLGCYRATTCQMTATAIFFSKSPTALPTAQPSGPTPAPSPTPTLTPTAPLNVFPYISGSLTDTNNANQNTVSVWQSACPGDNILFSTCSQFTGDTYIRLYLAAGLEDLAGGYSTGSSCSQIDYTYTAASCGTLELRLGCTRATTCRMTATAIIFSKSPTALPTAQPTNPTPAPSPTAALTSLSSVVDLAEELTTGYIIQGADEGGLLGTSVSAAGDVNGDGFADFVVGAPNWNGDKTGLAYVIFGFGNSSARLNLDLLGFVSGSKGFIIQGAAAGDYLGVSVSGAGDVNGDGYADVIVGAILASPNGRSQSGAAYVIFGKASGFATVDLATFVSSDSTGFIIQGALAGDFLGYSVRAAGDVNKDGYADASGFATLDLLDFVSGNSTGFIIQGASSNDGIGDSFSAAGDVNGDGIVDFVVGAYSTKGDTGDFVGGVVYVILGQASGLGTVDLATFHSSDTTGFIIQGAAAGDDLGRSVSGAGDVNGDGFADIIVGAQYASLSGAAYVIFCKASGLGTVNLLGFVSSDTTGFIIQGAAAGDLLGSTVSGAGDVNGDGYADVIVGAQNADPSGRIDAGAAYVIYGKKCGLQTMDVSVVTADSGFIIFGAVAGEILGASVSGAGDVNGDGIDDVIVGAIGANHTRCDTITPGQDAEQFRAGCQFSGAAYVLFGIEASATAVVGAELTAEQQPISTAIGSALYSAVVGAELTAEQQPVSTAIGSAIYSSVVRAKLTAEQQPVSTAIG